MAVRRGWFGFSLAAGLVLVLAGCAAQTTLPAPSSAAQITSAPVTSAPGNADDFVIVDCTLPIRLRKLGNGAGGIKQIGGKLIRTPVTDCRIRGGSYISDDPGSYAGAIKRWTEPAAAGDLQAQTNLGALYERSSPPDYAQAAQWYQKAADQNFAPAKIALGELYELGRGVPKDPVKALNLYRQASGISGKTLDFIEPATESPPPGAPKQTASAEPPSIEIVYPLATNGGEPSKLRVRAASTSTTVVGRVVAHADIKQADAGGKPIKIDSEGYFTLPMADVAKGTLRLTATDILGRSAVLDLSLATGEAASRDPAASAAKGNFGAYYALVIGNSRFEHWDQIGNAENDARAIDETLRKHYGFKSTLLLNASRRDMLQAFNQLREQMTENDNLVIYYAGHGQLNPQVDRGYWIPIDADADSDAEWILNEQITDYLQIIPAKHILVIADSCYAGVLTRSSVQRPKPGIDLLSRAEAVKALALHKVRTVMTSGGVQPVLDSGVNGHSVFANALIKVLNENADLMEANRLFDAISPQVVSGSAQYHYNQTPTYRALTYAGHEGGDFLFVPTGG
jgi:hypothetical protein